MKTQNPPVARWSTALVAICLLALVGLTIYKRRHPSLTEAAANLADCYRAENVGCLYAFVDESDRKSYGLTPERLRQLITLAKSYAKPTDKPTDIEMHPSSSLASVSLPAASERGKLVSIGFMVSDTDEGMKAPGFVTSLLLSLSSTHFVPTSTKIGAREKLQAWADFAREDGPKFAAIGIDGIVRSPEEGKFTWAEWGANCQERLKRVDALEARVR